MHPCPACGFQVFAEPPGSYEICNLCGWEDDAVQLQNPNYAGGANKSSLNEYQKSVVLPEFPPEVKETLGFVRCSNWRPNADK